MKVIAIIQARLTSKRFPGKIKEKIGSRMLLEHLCDRVRLAKLVDKIIIASPHSPECCLNEEIFIGSENDVLDRYYQCAKKAHADIVVRLTADCPFTPPFEINRVVAHILKTNADYVTNRPAVLDGWDVEAFTFKTLEEAWNKAYIPYDREHVTPYIKNGEEFKRFFLDAPKLSIDTNDDLQLVKEFYELERADYLSDRRDGEFCDKLHQVSLGERTTQSYSSI